MTKPLRETYLEKRLKDPTFKKAFEKEKAKTERSEKKAKKERKMWHIENWIWSLADEQITEEEAIEGIKRLFNLRSRGYER